MCAGSRRDFPIACRALAASTACWVTVAEFSFRQWVAEVSCPGATKPVWPACWIDIPDRSASSSSQVVQDIWDIYNEELGIVLPGIIPALGAAFEAEAGLLQAYCRAGGPVSGGWHAFLGRGADQIRRRRLGGRAVRGGAARRLYRGLSGG